MRRRTFLTAAATVVTGGLAGCSSSEPGDDKVGGQPTKTLTERDGGARTLAFGEALELPRVAITLSKPRATEAYRWSENGEDRVAKAGDGKQWIVVGVRAENTTDRRVRLPLTMDFEGVAGNRVFHAGRNRSTVEKYVGGKVPPGATREGDITFLTGADVSTDGFRVLYEEHRSSGEHRVWWEH